MYRLLKVLCLSGMLGVFNHVLLAMPDTTTSLQQASLAINNQQDWRHAIHLLSSLDEAALTGIERAQYHLLYAYAYYIGQQFEKSREHLRQVTDVEQLPNEWQLSYNELFSKSSASSAKSVPQKIALLLPLQGNLATQARAIQQGFMAAHQKQKTTTKISTQIISYDVSQEPLTTVIKKIADEDIDFIVGPLTKEQVQEMAQSHVDIPVLALNRIEKAAPSTDFYQFGLAPEEEAEQIADKAWQDGHRQALIVQHPSTWGQRIAKSFQQSWQARSGMLAKQIILEPSLDLNDAIKQLFTDTAGDFILLITTAEQARALKTKLDMYNAKKLPIYATASLYQGQVHGLTLYFKGITLCDIPWLSPSSRKDTLAIPALMTPALARLFALGYDSHHLMTELSAMQQNPHYTVPGLTGDLRLNAQRQVARQLTCHTL